MPTTRKSKWLKRKKPLRCAKKAQDKAHRKRRLSWAELFGQLDDEQKRQAQWEEREHAKEAYRLAAVRDDHRCQHPGCNSMEVQIHHIRFRSRGGKNDEANLVSLCFIHHAGDEGPHRSDKWRRYWEEWAAERYPEYWEEIDKYGKTVTVTI